MYKQNYVHTELCKDRTLYRTGCKTELCTFRGRTFIFKTTSHFGFHWCGNWFWFPLMRKFWGFWNQRNPSDYKDSDKCFQKRIRIQKFWAPAPYLIILVFVLPWCVSSSKIPRYCTDCSNSFMNSNKYNNWSNDNKATTYRDCRRDFNPRFRKGAWSIHNGAL